MFIHLTEFYGFLVNFYKVNLKMNNKSKQLKKLILNVYLKSKNYKINLVNYKGNR